MNNSALINTDGKIRQFIETLSQEELVTLYKSVTTAEFVGLISSELKKNITASDLPRKGSIMETNAKEFVRLWEFANSPRYLVGISDLLRKQASEELAELMNEFSTHG